jgi:RHS repeat-associated protein
LFYPVISDYRGNILGVVTNGVVSWTPARPTGFGAVPGYRPVALGSGASIAMSSAWRGRWVDITGYHQLGLRPYDPVSGRWLTYDSVWNERDPNAYTFCGGDPVNGFDSNGKCVENAPPSLNITPTTPPPLFNADLSLNLSAMQPLDVSSLSPSLQNQSAFGLNYEATSTMIDSANLVYDVTGESRLASWTIGVGTMSAISPGSISLYNSGWATGNGYTKVIGTVGDISEYGGNILTGVGILYGGYNYANNRESGLQFGADTTVSVTAVGLSYSGLTIGGAEAGGPLGIALGGGYLAGGLINNYVPGVSGAAQTVFQPFMNAYYSPIYQATYDPNSIESNVNSVANPFP